MESIPHDELVTLEQMGFEVDDLEANTCINWSFCPEGPTPGIYIAIERVEISGRLRWVATICLDSDVGDSIELLYLLEYEDSKPFPTAIKAARWALCTLRGGFADATASIDAAIKKDCPVRHWG